MKKLPVILCGIICLFSLSFKKAKNEVIAEGRQPQIAVDNKGLIRVVYGLGDQIFCASSEDHGASFTRPVLIASVPNMHLGMSRGPQIASSANYTVVTEIDKAGNIHWFRLNHQTNKWVMMGIINDLTGSAPEGLMSIASDKKDNFYAAWLDIRTGKKNQVYFSSIAAKGTRWAANKMVYQSPDGHVCECCKPNIAVNGTAVAIMFRNWLNGSRDLYVTRSANAGKDFDPAQKMGMDTWKLNACTMDGGGILIGNKGAIHTAWQRKGDIYYAQPGQPEKFIAKGRTCDISGQEGNLVLTFQNNDTVKMASLKTGKVTAVDKGTFLQTYVWPDNKTLCLWEQGSIIKFKTI